MKKYLKVSTNIAGIFVLGLGFLGQIKLEEVLQQYALDQNTVSHFLMICGMAAIFAICILIYGYLAVLIWDIGYWTAYTIFKDSKWIVRRSKPVFSTRESFHRVWTLYSLSCWLFLIFIMLGTLYPTISIIDLIFK